MGNLLVPEPPELNGIVEIRLSQPNPIVGVELKPEVSLQAMSSLVFQWDRLPTQEEIMSYYRKNNNSLGDDYETALIRLVSQSKNYIPCDNDIGHPMRFSVNLLINPGGVITYLVTEPTIPLPKLEAPRQWLIVEENGKLAPQSGISFFIATPDKHSKDDITFSLPFFTQQPHGSLSDSDDGPYLSHGEDDGDVDFLSKIDVSMKLKTTFIVFSYSLLSSHALEINEEADDHKFDQKMKIMEFLKREYIPGGFDDDVDIIRGSKRFSACPRFSLNNDIRRHSVKNEIVQASPDIICLQEVDEEILNFWERDSAFQHFSGFKDIEPHIYRRQKRLFLENFGSRMTAHPRHKSTKKKGIGVSKDCMNSVKKLLKIRNAVLFKRGSFHRNKEYFLHFEDEFHSLYPLPGGRKPRRMPRGSDVEPPEIFFNDFPPEERLVIHTTIDKILEHYGIKNPHLIAMGNQTALVNEFILKDVMSAKLQRGAASESKESISVKPSNEDNNSENAIKSKITTGKETERIEQALSRSEFGSVFCVTTELFRFQNRNFVSKNPAVKRREECFQLIQVYILCKILEFLQVREFGEPNLIPILISGDFGFDSDSKIFGFLENGKMLLEEPLPDEEKAANPLFLNDNFDDLDLASNASTIIPRDAYTLKAKTIGVEQEKKKKKNKKGKDKLVEEEIEAKLESKKQKTAKTPEKNQSFSDNIIVTAPTPPNSSPQPQNPSENNNPDENASDLAPTTQSPTELPQTNQNPSELPQTTQNPSELPQIVDENIVSSMNFNLTKPMQLTNPNPFENSHENEEGMVDIELNDQKFNQSSSSSSSSSSIISHSLKLKELFGKRNMKYLLSDKRKSEKKNECFIFYTPNAVMLKKIKDVPHPNFGATFPNQFYSSDRISQVAEFEFVI